MIIYIIIKINIIIIGAVPTIIVTSIILIDYWVILALYKSWHK